MTHYNEFVEQLPGKGDESFIYKWDFHNGTVEKYNKRGMHLGEFNHETGVQTKQADAKRRIEP